MSLVASLRHWSQMVKLSHTIFALPFAFSGAALAAAEHGFRWSQLGWIAVAMFGARNAAMGFNRLADQAYDAANPRTARRELPAGKLSRRAVWILTLLLTLLFVYASFQLNRLCGALSPLALLLIFGYSLTKRFTWASHLALGLALAIAPVGGWLAIAGRFSGVEWLLAGVVLLWVAGFDIIYSCQDAEFDAASGLHSIPQRFGLAWALGLARALHVLAFVGMLAIGASETLALPYWIACIIIAGLMFWQHTLVRPSDLSRLGLAFFNLNAVISVVFFLGVVAALRPG